MGLLDDLRKQTSDLQAIEQKQAERRAQAEATYAQEIRPRLLTLHKNLYELVKHLNYIKPDTRADYPMNKDRLTATLRQGEYKLEIDSMERTKCISLYFKCVGDREFAFPVAGAEQIDKHVSFLNQYNLKFHCRRYKNENHQIIGADFEVQPYVPIHFIFKADVENACIRLSVRNFPNLGQLQYILQPHNINEEFFDNLGRYILRENMDFLKLDISEEERARIRLQIEAENLRREQELQQTPTGPEPEDARFQLFKKQK